MLDKYMRNREHKNHIRNRIRSESNKITYHLINFSHRFHDSFLLLLVVCDVELPAIFSLEAKAKVPAARLLHIWCLRISRVHHQFVDMMV